MRKILIAAVAVAAMAGGAQAQQQGRQGRPGGGPGMGQFDPGRMFDRIDANRDGQISRPEFAAAHAKMREHRMERRAMMMRGQKGENPRR